MSVTRSCHESSSTEADLQSCHRSGIGASTDDEPKERSQGTAKTRVLAQPERHRRASAIYGYSTALNQKTAQNCSQGPYKRCAVGVDHLRVPMSEDIELMTRDQQMRSSESGERQHTKSPRKTLTKVPVPIRLSLDYQGAKIIIIHSIILRFLRV
jgi:hypothetical protein